MERRADRTRIACALALLATFAALLIMHLNCDNLLLDDWTFFGALEGGGSLFSFLASRWQTWSSRLLVEGTLCLTTRSIWAWRLLDSAALTLAAWALCRIADCERRADMLALSGLLIVAIPFAILRSTGWQATTVNYVWPLACTLAAIAPLADAVNGRARDRRFACVAPLLALFAANQEQTAVALLGAHAVLLPLLKKEKKRVPPEAAIVLAVSAAELCLHLACPGNALRTEQSYAMVNLRDYAQFSLVQRLSVGLTSTNTLLFFTVNPVFLMFLACALCTAIARRRKPWALALCAAPPLVNALCLAAWRMGADGPLAPLAAFGSYVLQLGPERAFLPGRAAAMLLLTAALLCCAVIPYLSLGERRASAVAAFAFLLGLAARMAVSLSPTVVESGERTMLPFYGAMMLCALLCVKDAREDGSNRAYLAAYAVAAVFAALNFASSFALAA